MKGSLSVGAAVKLDNSSQDAQNALLGTNLRIALQQTALTNPKHVLYLDGTNGTDGNGDSWDTAFNNPVTAIARLNQLAVQDPGKVYTLKIAPDFYTITQELILTADRCHILAVGAPEDTVFFGSGLTGDLLTIKGGYNIITGLTLYNHLNTKAALAFDDASGGGAYGGFSIVDNCQFSPQAVDGQNYGIYIKGGNFIEIQNCRFQATKQAGVYFVSGVGNSVRVRVRYSTFIGCNNGIEIAGPAYNVISQENVFVDGTEAAGENYNRSILTTAAFTAGSVIDVGGKHGGANEAACFTNGGSGTLQIIGSSYIAGSDTVEQLVTEQSKTGPVEEDAIINFAIGIFDLDTGAIASANIDISSISAVLQKSTGGGAFSDVGITQPTFTKANGNVSVDYRFLAAEWEIGDVYKLVVSGITVTLGGDTAYIKTMSWSNVITEFQNIEGKIDAIQADLGDPSSRTNLQTLEAMLGNPDTAGKTIYAQNEPTITSASFNYLDAGSTQDIVEVTNTSKVFVHGIFVDCNTLTQNGTLSFWTKVDGTNYRKVKDVSFTVASDDSVMLDVNISTDKDFKFTWLEGADEGADRALPYKISYEVRN